MAAPYPLSTFSPFFKYLASYEQRVRDTWNHERTRENGGFDHEQAVNLALYAKRAAAQYIETIPTVPQILAGTFTLVDLVPDDDGEEVTVITPPKPIAEEFVDVYISAEDSADPKWITNRLVYAPSYLTTSRERIPVDMIDSDAYRTIKFEYLGNKWKDVSSVISCSEAEAKNARIYDTYFPQLEKVVQAISDAYTDFVRSNIAEYYEYIEKDKKCWNSECHEKKRSVQRKFSRWWDNDKTKKLVDDYARIANQYWGLYHCFRNTDTLQAALTYANNAASLPDYSFKAKHISKLVRDAGVIEALVDDYLDRQSRQEAEDRDVFDPTYSIPPETENCIVPLDYYIDFTNQTRDPMIQQALQTGRVHVTAKDVCKGVLIWDVVPQGDDWHGGSLTEYYGVNNPTDYVAAIEPLVATVQTLTVEQQAQTDALVRHMTEQSNESWEQVRLLGAEQSERMAERMFEIEAQQQQDTFALHRELEMQYENTATALTDTLDEVVTGQRTLIAQQQQSLDDAAANDQTLGDALSSIGESIGEGITGGIDSLQGGLLELFAKAFNPSEEEMVEQIRTMMRAQKKAVEDIQ